MVESICIEQVGTPGVTSAMNLDVTSAKNPAAWKNLRLEEEDIERCSIVVPDLADIRLGDLVVAFGDGKGIPTELGIVVGLPETLPARGSDQREFLKQVVVLSVRQEFRQVTLGTWATGGSVFGGFSKAPLRAHVRRLIKRNGSPETTNDQVAWDLADYMTGSVSVKIGKMKEQSSNLKNVKERWIPNTGEYLVLDGIKLERTLKVSGVTVAAPLALSTGDYEVVIYGALDRGYDAAPANVDSGNIYRNTEEMFELVLLNETTEDTKRIGRLTPKTGESGHYYVDYTNNLSDIYNPDGSAKISSTNGVSTQTRIVWNDSLEIVGSNGEKLAIRPASADTARTGDDLLLQFGIRKTGEKDFLTMFDPATGTSSPAVATAVEADYVAVYDKKMLWRANLYIDEGGMNDWNNVHPWNDSSNEWNWDYRNPGLFVGDYPTQPGDGKQVVKMPTTTWSWNGKQMNVKNEKTLAYDYWGWDNPFTFTRKIFEQSTILNHWYSSSGVQFLKSISEWVSLEGMTDLQKKTQLELVINDTVWTTDLGCSTLAAREKLYEAFRTGAERRWQSTEAPPQKSDGRRYARSSDFGVNYNFWFNTNAIWTNPFKLPVNGIPQTYATLSYNPYVPGLSMILAKENAAGFPQEGSSDHGFLQQFTAGADCLGFLQSSLSYNGVQYMAMKTDSRKVRPSSWSVVGSIANKSSDNAMDDLSNTQSILILSADDSVATKKKSLQYVMLGDIFFYNNNGGLHIGTIGSIDPIKLASDNLSTQLEGIRILESTHNESLGLFGAGNTSTLNTYSTLVNRPWEIRRLK
jgi:hypothetical protein